MERKVVREFPQNGNKPMAYYQRAGGGWDHLDFGATCTGSCSRHSCAAVLRVVAHRTPYCCRVPLWYWQ